MRRGVLQDVLEARLRGLTPVLVGDDDWLFQPVRFRSSLSGSEIVERDLALQDPRRSLMALPPIDELERDIERIRVQLALGFSPPGEPAWAASLVRRAPIPPTDFLLPASALLSGELVRELSGESSLVENVSSQMSANEDFLTLVFT